MNKSDSEMEEDSNEEVSKVHNIPGYKNMEDFNKEGFSIIRESIGHANKLPLSDFDHLSLKKSFKNVMAGESNRILSMMNKILKQYQVKGNFKTSSLEFKADLLVETNDSILEKVADSIDEIGGIKKLAYNPDVVTLPPAKINGSWNRNLKPASPLNFTKQTDTSSSTLKSSTQKYFTDKIDNSNDRPWQPRIKEKPNSLKPLSVMLEETERGEEFSHPYETELEKFSVPEEQLTIDEEEPVFPKPLEETKFVEVDTEEKLNELLEDLRKYKIIAIDLEHHSFRSFMGITCLMQISTGDTDYIIDTLVLRNKLFILNEVFTKPTILKLFHGADSDILWLQRDLSLYIVNMFDTHQAAKVLGYSSLSLAYLLERFCNVTPNKIFQKADWRIRPLSDELKKYAREDTHYLIYIYKMMKIEVLKKSGNDDRLLNIVYDRSTDICKRRFFKQRCTEDSFLDFYDSCNRHFDKKQLFALKELYYWRNQIARDYDESLGYVLPNHMLIKIAEELPREMQNILSLCNPVPPFVRSNLLELHQIILKARDISLDQPILQEDIRARGAFKERKFIDSRLFSPFDNSHLDKEKNMTPGLLEDGEYDLNDILNKEIPMIKSEPIIRMGGPKEKVEIPPLKNYRTLTPYQRYACVKLFAEEEQKQKEAEMIQKELPKQVDVKPVISEVILLQDDEEEIQENLTHLINENRTEKERFDSIKNHLNLLSRKTQEDIETQKRLEENLYKKASAIITERQASVMNIEKCKKRKREDSEERESSSEDEMVDQKPSKKSLNNRGTKPNRGNFQGVDTSRSEKDKSRKRKSKDGNTHNWESKKAKTNTPKKCHSRNEKHDGNNDRNIEAFDYSSVDFRQFEGGAGAVNKRKVFGSKFKTNRKNPNNRGKRHQ